MIEIFIKDLINNLEKYDEKLNVLIFSEKVNPQSKCILIPDKEIEKYENYTIIGLYEIKDILENLMLQRAKFTEQEVIDAINFYIQHDAFMVLREESELNPKEHIDRQRREISNIAKKMLQKNFDLIEGCIEIRNLWLEAELPLDESYNFFTLIDSDTETFPNGYLREICSKEYLSIQDKKKKKYLEVFEKKINEECQKLIEKYG